MVYMHLYSARLSIAPLSALCLAVALSLFAASLLLSLSAPLCLSCISLCLSLSLPASVCPSFSVSLTLIIQFIRSR